MDKQFSSILSIESNLANADYIARQLKIGRADQFYLQKIAGLDEAIALLAKTDFAAIIWSFLADESQSLDGLTIVRKKVPQTPIIVLTDTTCLHFALRATHLGAQNCLIKAELTGENLWRAIQLAIVRQQTEFKLHQSALMKQMLDRIRSALGLEAIAQTIATVIQEFTQTDRVLIYRYQSRVAEMVVAAQSSSKKLDLSAREKNEVSLPDFPAILNVSTAETIVEDTLLDRPPDLPLIAPQLVRSYLLLPVWLEASEDGYSDLSQNHVAIDEATVTENERGLWGTIVAYNVARPRRWREWEIDFLRQLISEATVTIQHLQLCCQLQTANQKLHKLAILDGLTGIANRRYFDLVLDKEWQRLAREQQPLSLIFADVDYFKAYNDTYGHQQGDRCLQIIAQILQQFTRRPADLVARYGGEEFALILPNTDASGALFLARRFVQQLALKKLPHSRSQVSDLVTLSIGITTKIPQPKQPSSTIIETADNLLYRAKKAGRNQLAVDG